MVIATREIHAALAIAAVGIIGGISLSAYTERGMWPQSRNVPVSAFTLPEANSAEIAPVARWEPPEQYMCKGCGPTLAERQMQYYTQGDYGYRTEILGEAPAEDIPLPADDVAPYEEGTAEGGSPEVPDARPSEQAAMDAAVVAYP